MPQNYAKMLLRKSEISVKPPFPTHSFSIKLLFNSLLLLASISLQAQCPTAPGDPSVFGDNTWNVYGYSNSDISLATAFYSGYYTQPTLGFDSQNSWNQGSSPANAEGWAGCTLDNEAFTFVYKRKGFPCGSYTVTMTSWDDASVVYIDGVEQWFCTSPSGGSCSGSIGEIALNEDTEIEVRVREDGGNSFASLTLVNNTVTLPGTLSPSGNTIICANTAPDAITLSGHSGDIVKWQSAEDAAFTTGVTDIVSTSSVLTPLDMGIIPATRYYRAVVQNGLCDPQYPSPVEIFVPEAVTFSGGAWSATPTETTGIILDDNFFLDEDITVCSCHVKTGKTLTVEANVSLTVITSVTVEADAELIVEDTGSLVQIEDSATNSGTIKIKRETQPMKTYDYGYWSSPVQNNTLFQLSPLTMSDKYYHYDPITNRWISIAGGAQAMEAGKGYIVRAPQGWAANNASSGVYSAEFNGIPNNGIISTAIQKGTGTFNLIGNPYPSAIDIDLFITDTANAGIVNGTIYLWTHNTAISSTIPGNGIYNYTADDYAAYNLSGGVRTAAAAITGGSIPTGKIASGQGFFIEAATGLADGTYSASFTNSMRLTGSNNQFFRTHLNTSQEQNIQLEKNRLWINISNTQGAYNQILVGYIANATNGFDNFFDGTPFVAANVLSMYSISDDKKYTIQGRALPFSQSDVVPVGYKTTIAGDFTIALEDFDGIFQDEEVYLTDTYNNVTQSLKNGGYTFTSAIGTFDNRFEISYGSQLGVNQPVFNERSVVVYKETQQIVINTGKTIMSKVQVYDIRGRLLIEKEAINASEIRLNAVGMNQVLIVKITDLDNNTVAKKIVN
jgi:hypothetical protein